MSLKKKSGIAIAAKAANIFAIASLVAACSGSNHMMPSKDQLVECYGVAKSGAEIPLLMTKEMCDKLPATKQTVVTSTDYVECYGVAAAGQNGCATKTNTCGGQKKVARAPDAWVSLPVGVCQNLQGGVVGATTDSSKKTS